MCEAIRVGIRYDTKDEHGETRRQRNVRFGQPEGPEIQIDASARYLWDWFEELSSTRQYGEGGPQHITWSDMNAWVAITGNIVRADEWQVLRDMDDAYMDAIGVERAEAAERAKEAAK